MVVILFLIFSVYFLILTVNSVRSVTVLDDFPHHTHTTAESWVQRRYLIKRLLEWIYIVTEHLISTRHWVRVTETIPPLLPWNSYLEGTQMINR